MKSLYVGQLAGTSGTGLCNHISAQLHGHMTEQIKEHKRTRAHTFVQQWDTITISLDGQLALTGGETMVSADKTSPGFRADGAAKAIIGLRGGIEIGQ